MRAMAIALAFGALAHRTGAVCVKTAATRDTAAWLHFLDDLERFAPPGGAFLIVDALPLHWSLETMLWNWGNPRFHFVPLPERAAWLNLIEGFPEDPPPTGSGWACLLHHG
jgi:DDE superfamily endonuclease